jgi:cell wall-associated NlpC family hydrolase
VSVSHTCHPTWFNAPERVARLEFYAAKWIGTPFSPNGNTPGPDGGVSCQKLVAAIYGHLGFNDPIVPEVAMSHAAFSSRSLVEEFMKSRKDFELLEPTESVLPGDLLAMRIKRITHHLGIVLQGRTFIHSMYHIGTVLSSLNDPTYGSALACVWRPRP